MKTIQKISSELAIFQADKSAIERDMQIAVVESKLKETILQCEIDLNAAKNALHVLKIPFADNIFTIDMRIQALEQDITQVWEQSGDINKTIPVAQGDVKIQTRSNVVIHDDVALLGLLIRQHNYAEVAAYITSFKKPLVRKLLGLFTIDPVIAEIITTHEAKLTLRGDTNEIA